MEGISTTIIGVDSPRFVKTEDNIIYHRTIDDHVSHIELGRRRTKKKS